MVWVVEKKVVHHMLGLGFEKVDIPISLSTHTVYNRKALERRYPGLDVASLEDSIGKTVKKEILDHLRECGFLDAEDDSGICL